jgi:MFS family permease
VTTAADAAAPTELLGLRANWNQFWLLVAVNAFVGAMVGLERSVLPLLAEREFGLLSKTVTLSFIATFGMVKAVTNLMAGRLGDLYGRRGVLIVGWLFALPVPLLVIWAPSWSWIIAANVLLGINQGLAWSATVIMKIDLLGPRQRGLAMGLNEFAGYVAVALSALATGYLAEAYGLRPEPFYLGIAFAAAGTALSVLFARETRHLVLHEAERLDRTATFPLSQRSEQSLFARVSWRDPALSSASQAGLVNNLNDGLAWGLLPLYFAAAGLSFSQVGVIAFIYPAVWSILQLGTGTLSDRWGRKRLIAAGMFIQAAALASIPLGSTFGHWVAATAALGVGTAMVYPTLLAAVGDVAHPHWRGFAVGIYRFWRDSGYVVGALVAGIVSDWFGMGGAIATVAALTAASGLLVGLRMPETLRPAP